MKNSKTSVKYRGDVTIEYRNSRKTYHNNGTSHLFDALSKFLCGSPMTPSIIPAWLMIYREPSEVLLNEPDTSEHTNRVLNKFVGISSSYLPKTQNNDTGIKYECVLSKTYLNSITVDEDTIASVALVSSDMQKILAVTRLVDLAKLVAVLEEGGSVTVRWDMYFGNGMSTASVTPVGE